MHFYSKHKKENGKNFHGDQNQIDEYLEYWMKNVIYCKFYEL